MEGNFNLESMFGFLQAACKSRQSMEQISLEQIRQAGQHMRLLKRLNEKGLLIVIIAKLLHHKFNQFP
jgi:BarA-like signal transduction histidine kinase